MIAGLSSLAVLEENRAQQHSVLTFGLSDLSANEYGALPCCNYHTRWWYHRYQNQQDLPSLPWYISNHQQQDGGKLRKIVTFLIHLLQTDIVFSQI